MDTVSLAQTKTTDSVTERIVRAVAHETGADPLDLPPLYETVDAEAIAKLCDSSRTDTPFELEFTYAGCRVALRGAEDVDVTVEEVA